MTEKIVRKERTIEDVFGVTGCKNIPVTTFEWPAGQRSPLIPKVDPDYVFDVSLLEETLVGIELGWNVLLTGPTGCGKTTLLEQIAARTGRECFRINLNAELTYTDLVGTFLAKDGETIYNEGPVPTALQRPAMLILDEIDAAEPNALMSLQMVLERGQIFIPEINKLISRTSCIISATANTNGWGDETGLHAGTSCQNFATFDRFQMVRDCDYNEATEKKLLKKNFEELLGTEVLKKLWEIFSHIRKDFKDGLVITPLSLRQMNAACSLAPIFGIRRACEVAMLGKASPADKANILAVVRRISET